LVASPSQRASPAGKAEARGGTVLEQDRLATLKLREGVCGPFLRIQKQGGNHAKIDFMGGRYCGCFGGGYDDWRSFASRRYRTNRLA
jgi:hypothetical protein